MSDSVYPAEQVDEILRETTEALEAALTSNVKLARENEALQTRLKKAEAAKVVLEKVANAPVFSREALQAFSRSLYTNGFLGNEEDAVKYASEMEKNPSLILDVASSVIKISAAMPTSGTGVEKKGSAEPVKAKNLRELEEDGFTALARSHRK